jgi:hypothetical protein
MFQTATAVAALMVGFVLEACASDIVLGQFGTFCWTGYPCAELTKISFSRFQTNSLPRWGQSDITASSAMCLFVASAGRGVQHGFKIFYEPG